MKDQFWAELMFIGVSIRSVFFSECLVSNYKVAHISLRSILRCRIIYDCIV